MDAENTSEIPYVLIIEDDPGHQRLLEIFIKRANCRCDCTFDGKTGLHKALENNYDLILVDIHVPEMDGYEVVSALREKGIETPAIAVTAMQAEGLEKKALASGFNGFFRKPIDRIMIETIIASHLSGEK